MQSLKKQNQQLRKAIQSVIEGIEHQKQLNAKHESEIETLLKFNEKLLKIIQAELNNKKDACSLQPISQRSERESDLLSPALNSLIRSRKLTPKSQKGFNTHNSLVEKVRATNNKLNEIYKENQGQKSQLDKSYDNDDLSDRKMEFKSTTGAISPHNLTLPFSLKSTLPCSLQSQNLSQTLQQSTLLKQEMAQGISDLRKFRTEGAQFYDDKIKQIKGLSSKLSNFKPTEQLKNISAKLTLSESTCQLLAKALQKGAVGN